MMQIAILVSIFVLVSLWEYCMFFYEQRQLPYAMGYNIFSMFQWVIIAAALIKLYGWLWGIIGLGICMALLSHITHFTLGIVYYFLFKDNPLPALALFSIMVWVTGILTIIFYFMF